MEFFKALKYYSRKDIQAEMLNFSKNREFIPQFRESFGKRPDIIQYNGDILEFVNKGAISFHVSEEQWVDPLALKTGMTKKQLDQLRFSWDLVIDVDFEIFECSRIITSHIITALKEHGIKNMFVKFSGNKGFHILIPFESFPENIKKYKTKDLFPEIPKSILFYLSDYVDNEKNGFKLSKEILANKSFQDYLRSKNKSEKDFVQEICTKCKKQKINEEKIEFVCPYCNKVYIEDIKTKFKTCERCKKLTEKINSIKIKCSCGNTRYARKINLSLDSILISSRHLFRAPYSLNEKSGLVSVPVNPDSVLSFDREKARMENIKEIKPFIDKSRIKSEEAKRLFNIAFQDVEESESGKKYKEFEIPKEALNIDNFPPCILLGLNGLEDGKKRFLFVLLNFLRSSGYQYEGITKIVLEWNKKNSQPLKDGYIQSQISWHKRQKQVPPPNCPGNSGMAYYTDLNICRPDSICKSIKNPAQYTVKKSKLHK